MPEPRDEEFAKQLAKALAKYRSEKYPAVGMGDLKEAEYRSGIDTPMTQEVTMPDDDVMGEGKALPLFEDPEPPWKKLRRYRMWKEQMEAQPVDEAATKAYRERWKNWGA